MNLVSQSLAWLLSSAQWSGAHSIPFRMAEHVVLVLVTVSIAGLIAIPLGVLVGHTGRGAGVIGAVSGALRAIPTLGLLTLFGMSLGIGVTAPLLALVILAIPSLLAGAYAGGGAIDPAVPSAAKAIGLSPIQVIARVEIPLAMPLIMGGLRAATLQVVATATLAAYIADVGLGRYLFAGLKTRDYPQMLGGAILVIALAVLAELAFSYYQRRSTRRAFSTVQQ